MNKKGRVAILLSGRGSNFEAIYQSSLKENANFKIAVVISDKKDARGLERAREFGLPTFFVSPKELRPKEVYEQRIVAILQEHHVDLVCLAGYMRIVGQQLLDAYKGRIMNIHPALLPSFPGLDAQQQALDYGVKVSGCTVHFVDSGVDTGPIILQAAVEVKDNDTEETLSNRILKKEHQIYSRAITLFFTKSLKMLAQKSRICDAVCKEGNPRAVQGGGGPGLRHSILKNLNCKEFPLLFANSSKTAIILKKLLRMT